MGRFISMTLDVPSSATAGAAKDARFLRGKTVQLDAPVGSDWTAVVEGTIDGTTWVALGTYVATGVVLAVTEAVQSIRIRLSAYVAAAPTATLAGYNARDEAA